MVVTYTPGAINKFRRAPWRFQQTVEIPQSNDLGSFAATIITAHGSIKTATVTIDAIVFETRWMTALCPSNTELPLQRESSLVAQSNAELETLLVAALQDGVDFICVPAPKPFVFYSVHDNWITFYANSKSNLNRIIEPVSSRGYRLIQNWQRGF